MTVPLPFRRLRTLTALLTRALLAGPVLAALLLSAQARAGGGPQNVLVVANRNAKRSVEIAEYYMAKRHIPRAQLVLVSTKDDRSIDFSPFRNEIADPIRRAIRERHLDNRIDFIVCTDGIPIRARLPGGWVSTCALLQVLDSPLFGRAQKRFPDLQNPYRDENKAFRHARGFEGHHLYLVTFLIGFDAEDAKRLVDLSVLSDGKPAKGDFVFQDARGNAAGRNPHYAEGIRRLQQKGFSAEHKPAGPDEVKDRKGLMGYMSGGCYSQLKRDRLKTLGFRPGALVDMLESFGAVPNNFGPKGHSQFPVTYFIEVGVTGIHGAVAEPYAHTFPDVRLFERYTQGFNLAESFYLSLPFLYWMNMVIGDPLAAPFAVPPRVTLKGATPTASRSLTLTVTAEAPSGAKVKETALFFAGREIGRAPGASLTVDWDTLKERNGSGELTAAAILDGDTAVQGHAFASVEVANDALTVVRTRPRKNGANAPCAGPFQIEFNQDVATASAHADGLAVKGPGGKTVRGKFAVDENRRFLNFEPDAPLAPATAHVWHLPSGIASAGGKTLNESEIRFTTTAARLAVTAPKTADAGSEFRIEVSAQDGSGKTWAGYRGTVRVTADDVQAVLPEERAFVEADRGKASVTLTLRTAGERVVRVYDEQAGLFTEVSVSVAPAEFAGVKVDLPRHCGMGQEVTATFTALDAFGNRVESCVREFKLGAPTAARATCPSRLAFKASDKGQVKVDTIVFGATGTTGLVLMNDTGERIGQGVTKVVDAGIMGWLSLGNFPAPGAKAEAAVPPADPAKIRAHPGRLLKGWAWQAKKSGSANTRVYGVSTGRFALYHAWVQATAGSGLRIGSSDILKVYVNGKPVHEVTKPRSFKADQDHVTSVGFAPGWNSVLVVAARSKGGAPQFSLKVVGSDGKSNPDGFRASLDDPQGNSRIDVSGRLRPGGAGVKGAKVRLEGSKNLETTTDGEGRFGFEDVPPGAYKIVPSKRGFDFAPRQIEIQVDKENLCDLDFDIVDKAAPKMTGLGLRERQKVAGRFACEVEAQDNLGVAEIRFALDGESFGEPFKKDKGVADLDFTGVTPGTYTFSAVAVDGAGNASTPQEVKIFVIRDTARPSIRMIQPRSTRQKLGKIEFEARVTDNIAVVRVLFQFDGTSFGKESSSAPFKATLDATKASPGWHKITIVAEDSSGNREEKTYKIFLQK